MPVELNLLLQSSSLRFSYGVLPVINGAAVSLAPGIIYVRGTSMFTASVGKALLRDRTRSVPDRILGTHGDAAFADYVWLMNYTYRF